MIDHAVTAARSASPLSQHTPALAVAANEEETVVVGPFTGETMVDAVVAATKPRRIPADPRLLKGAAEIEATIIAVLRAHGLTVVREADTSYFDADKEKAFAKECGRNAMQTVLGALEEVAA